MEGNPADSVASAGSAESTPRSLKIRLQAIRNLRVQYWRTFAERKKCYLCRLFSKPLYQLLENLTALPGLPRRHRSSLTRLKVGSKPVINYYQAYTFALDQSKQSQLAEKAQ